MEWVRAQSSKVSVAIDPAIGNLRALSFQSDDRQIDPLNIAPWVADDSAPTDLSPVERHLAGDFFCAPFGISDVDPAPPHGWTANSRWSVTAHQENSVTLRLDRDVQGARITKTLHASDVAPILYQSHVIDGGSGALTVAHHPMVNVAGGARMSTSPKRAILTADEPLEPGRNALARSTRSMTLARVPAEGGGTIDLTNLPIATGCEDFITLVEGAGALGWTALVRDAEDDIVFFLKDPRILPVTMLWHSNGGRDYAPWNGQHHGIIGIEDGCAAGVAGHRAAFLDSPVSREGVPTALPLGGRIRVAHVIGALPRPQGWTHVADITLRGEELTLTNDEGADIRLPFDPNHFPETP